MKAIKCPNCGSEQVKELTEEKYACMACDNVFLIHNHSKEFRKTDEHISSMHQDLKDDISKLMNSSNIDPDAIIEKAEQARRLHRRGREKGRGSAASPAREDRGP